MAWQTVAGAESSGRSVALYPGAWDPPTAAHLAVARAARDIAGHVVWVLPRAFPHKTWNPVGHAERIAMLSAVAASEEGFSVALTDGGLYRDIADEARDHFGLAHEISLVCGRDAAERIANWDYGVAGAYEDLLARYRLLVAAREGEYDPLAHVSPALAGRVVPIAFGGAFDLVSSSEVRRRIAAGEPWVDLVPQAVVKMVRELYISR